MHSFRDINFTIFLDRMQPQLIKNGPIPASFFVYFCSFLVIISTQIEKSIDGVHGIRTWGRRMVGADETTELWRPPYKWYYDHNLAP